MKVSDFDFELPRERIALRPVSPRDRARLMVVQADGAISDRIVADLPSLLKPGDVMVFNDTRVIPARLSGVRTRGDNEIAVQATLLKRIAPNRWASLMKPGKRLRPGDRIHFGQGADNTLDATVEAKGEEGEVIIAFDLAGPALDRAVAEAGVMPLPPYIAALRPEDERDRDDYQTVYARQDGSVAAPTAGLHFTPDLLAALDAAGIERRAVTLHVGGGTFLPIRVEDTDDHRMHAETGEISAATADALNAARAEGRRIVCVGTTALRILESAADANGRISPFAGDTDIFITPGYPFRTVDVLMSNFHLPRSTLLMLLSAFAGMETVRAAYAHAIAADYRFYSYGDAGLWFGAEA